MTGSEPDIEARAAHPDWLHIEGLRRVELFADNEAGYETTFAKVTWHVRQGAIPYVETQVDDMSKLPQIDGLVQRPLTKLTRQDCDTIRGRMILMGWLSNTYWEYQPKERITHTIIAPIAEYITDIEKRHLLAYNRNFLYWVCDVEAMQRNILLPTHLATTAPTLSEFDIASRGSLPHIENTDIVFAIKNGANTITKGDFIATANSLFNKPARIDAFNPSEWSAYYDRIQQCIDELWATYELYRTESFASIKGLTLRQQAVALRNYFFFYRTYSNNSVRLKNAVSENKPLYYKGGQHLIANVCKVLGKEEKIPEVLKQFLKPDATIPDKDAVLQPKGKKASKHTAQADTDSYKQPLVPMLFNYGKIKRGSGDLFDTTPIGLQSNAASIENALKSVNGGATLLQERRNTSVVDRKLKRCVESKVFQHPEAYERAKEAWVVMMDDDYMEKKRALQSLYIDFTFDEIAATISTKDDYHITWEDYAYIAKYLCTHVMELFTFCHPNKGWQAYIAPGVLPAFKAPFEYNKDGIPIITTKKIDTRISLEIKPDYIFQMAEQYLNIPPSFDALYFKTTKPIAIMAMDSLRVLRALAASQMRTQYVYKKKNPNRTRMQGQIPLEIVGKGEASIIKLCDIRNFILSNVDKATADKYPADSVNSWGKKVSEAILKTFDECAKRGIIVSKWDKIDKGLDTRIKLTWTAPPQLPKPKKKQEEES